MSKIRHSLSYIAALTFASAPVALRAQGSLAAGARVAATPDAPRRHTAEAPARSPRLVSLVLTHKFDLGLTNEQVRQLSAISSRLDLVVSPLEAEIDSLTLRGEAREWAHVDSAQSAILREQVRKRSALVAAVRDELLLARTHTLDALTETQQRAATELEDAQRKADVEKLRVARGGGWNGVNQTP